MEVPPTNYIPKIFKYYRWSRYLSSRFSETIPRIRADKVKKRWFQRLCVKETTEVSGSESQLKAPIAVHADTIANSTEKYQIKHNL